LHHKRSVGTRNVGLIDIRPSLGDCEAMHKRRAEAMYLEFGARVRTLRLGLGLHQEAVAEHLNLSRTSVSNIEAGRQRLLLHQAVALAELFSVHLDDLIPSAGPSLDSTQADQATELDYDRLVSLFMANDEAR
jgi:transcriptional regulator with XRE-family HTH domain